MPALKKTVEVNVSLYLANQMLSEARKLGAIDKGNFDEYTVDSFWSDDEKIITIANKELKYQVNYDFNGGIKREAIFKQSRLMGINLGFREVHQISTKW